MRDISANEVAALAREMAMALRKPVDILTTFRMDQEEFEYIQALDYYKRCYESFVMEWESAGSTNKRIALQSAAALEQALPELAKQILVNSQPLSSRNEVAKTLAKLAGAGEPKQGESSTEKFKIIINLGADQQVFDETVTRTIDVTPTTVTQAPTGSEIPTLTKGESPAS